MTIIIFHSCKILMHWWKVPLPLSCQAAFPTFCILSALRLLQRFSINSWSSFLTTFRVGSLQRTERKRFADVSAPSALILPQKGQSTQLPTWQQNTFTYKDFYYFYLILWQLQPWKSGSPTLKDAPTKNAAVSLPACCQNKLAGFQGCISALSRWYS